MPESKALRALEKEVDKLNERIQELETAKTIGIQACDVLKERIKELETGIILYIELNKHRQFTKPATIKKISKYTGIEYKPSHIIGAIILDLEKALKG